MASTEIKSESNTDIKVILAPVSSIENITEKQNVKFLQLRHPRTGQGKGSFFFPVKILRDSRMSNKK